MHEINVTPLVDVMLVLLVVFMVTAPLLTVGVPVDLPKTQAEAISEDQKPLTVTIRADGTVFLQEEIIQIDELTPKLLAIAESGYDERIYVRGDKTVNYGSVMEVMGTINTAGFRRVALITEPEINF
jgi:biopolymer transport protein TolR